MALSSSPPAVVAARFQLLDFGSRKDLLAAKIKLAVVCGGHDWSLCSVQRRGADGALGTETKSLSMLRSASNGVGASDFIHVDDPEVRSHPRRTATFL